MSGNSCGLDGGNVASEVIPVIVLQPMERWRFSQLLPGVGVILLEGLLRVLGLLGWEEGALLGDTKHLRCYHKISTLGS